MSCSILAIDDHDLFCAGLELILLQRIPDARFEAFRTVDAALGLQGHPPDAILLDVKLEGGDGLDAVPRIRQVWPGAEIIVLSSEVTPAIVERAARVAVRSCLSKAENPEVLVELIRSAIPILKETSDAQAPRLTPRQIETLVLIREGFSNKAIANRLGVSAFTTQAHIQAIFRTLAVSSRTQAVFEAQRLRIIK